MGSLKMGEFDIVWQQGLGFVRIKLVSQFNESLLGKVLVSHFKLVSQFNRTSFEKSLLGKVCVCASLCQCVCVKKSPCASFASSF